MGTFVGANANGGNVAALTSGAGFPVNWPAGVQAGDLAILAWSFGDSTVTVTSDPTGFTLVNQTNDGNLQSRILKRACTGTESGSISGWLLSLANRQSAVLYVVRGYSDIGGFVSRAETVTGTSHDCPAITTASGAASGDSLVVIGADRAASTGASPPAGFSERTGTEGIAAGTGGTVTTLADDGLSTGATLPVDPAAFTGYVSGGTAVTWTIALRPAATNHSATGDRSSTAGLSGAASLAKSAVGTLAAAVALTGQAAGTRSASGSITATSSLLGSASASKPASGNAAITATLTGVASLTAAPKEASGDRTITATLTGWATPTRAGGGNLSTTATLAGVGGITRVIVGDRSTTASLTGTASLQRVGSGDLLVSAGLVGSVVLEQALAGALQATASLTGEAAVYAHFDAPIHTTATARALVSTATARPTASASVRRPAATATVRSPRMTVGFKQGDLEPPLVIDITGEGADLNDVETWRVIGRRRGSADLIIDAATIPEVDPDDPSKAVVTHLWEAPETDTLGVLLIEVEAEWPGGRKQTFPSSGYVQVRITDDLG